MSLMVADIGGTNSRFALAGSGPAELSHVTAFPNDDFDDFAAVLTRALAQMPTAPKRIIIAVAGPNDGVRATLTNRGWRIDPQALAHLAPGAEITVINDFEAQAHALPWLSDAGLKTITPEASMVTGHKLVVGAGTGLGVGFLIRCQDRWIAAPGEGGHVTLPVQSEREFQIMRAALGSLDRLSAERFLSGPGLVTLNNTICRDAGRSDLAKEPADVTAAAAAGDPQAMETCTLFTTLLARLTGDQAISLIPRGGIYLGGGVTPHVLSVTGTDGFVTEMRRKGRVSAAIATIPAHIIVDPRAGLIGVAAYAQSCVHTPI